MTQPRLKTVARIIAGQSPSGESYVDYPKGMPFLQGCAEFGSEFPTPTKGTLEVTKIARKGSLLLSVRAPVGELNLADRDYCIGRGLCAIEPSGATNHGWLRWAVEALRPTIASMGNGSTYDAVTTEDIGNVRLTVPASGAQAEIAALLDRETTRIDALLAQKKHLLALLEEKREALVSRAVTKGLNPTALMKDSRVAFGLIPAHWLVAKLRRVGRVDQGTSFPHAIQGQASGEIPWYKVDDMNAPGNEIEMDSAANYVSPDIAREFGASIFPTGSTIFPRVGAALLTNKRRMLSRPAITDDNVYAFIPDAIDASFAYYWLRQLNMATVCTPGLVPTVTTGSVKDYVIALPPREEQEKIVEFVREVESRSRSLADNLTRSVALLRERRQSLITSAVTGELDLRIYAQKGAAE